MEDLEKSQTLESASKANEIQSAVDDTVVESNLEPIEIFLEQPDGSKVRISFLASGEIEGVPQTYELAPNVEVVEEPSQSLSIEDTEPLTFVNAEEPQKISAIQTPDGQIYYFESNPLSKNGKDSPKEAPIFYTLLPKDLYITPELQSNSVNQLDENNLSNKDKKDNVYTIAREKLKPFVTVHKTIRRTESTIKQIGADLPLEDKMAALAALLPAPRGSRRKLDRGRARRGNASTRLRAKEVGASAEPVDINVNPANSNADAGAKEADLKASQAGADAVEESEAVDEAEAVADADVMEDAEAVEDAEASYRCDRCDSAFGRAAQLFGHSKAHARECTLRCSQCAEHKVFGAHAQLTGHERQWHVVARPHACAQCGATFDRKSELANHVRRIHLEERDNECAVCGKSFFKRSDLRSHLNIHLSLDAHVCPTCGRRFGHVSNLDRHLRTHTGTCPPCTPVRVHPAHRYVSTLHTGTCPPTCSLPWTPLDWALAPCSIFKLNLCGLRGP